MKKENFFKKVQKLNDFSKKWIVYGIIVVLALPFVFFLVKNLEKNISKLEEERILKETNFSEIEEKKKELQNQLDQLEELEEQIATSSTSTE